MKERILVVEDDEGIIRVLRRALTYEGYTVDTAPDGETALNLVHEHQPDLVVLDLMLPGMDGLEVCQRIRSQSSMPIIMLTAKDAIQDRILGLDAGADDYLVKPFDLEELLARLRALLRRTQMDRSTTLTFADLSLDTFTRIATRGTREITLTAKEYDLLELFLRHPRQVLSRDKIFDRVWGKSWKAPVNRACCLPRAASAM